MIGFRTTSFWIAVFAISAAALLSGCPGAGGESDKGKHPAAAVSLILPSLAEPERGASTPEWHAAAELRLVFETLKAQGSVTGEVITAEKLNDESVSESVADSKAVIVSEGFTGEEIFEFAEALSGRVHVFVFSDAEFPDGMGVTAVSFDYMALGFLGGAFAGLMTKSGKLGAFFDESAYRGEALVAGVRQGARWTRGGASIDAAAPKDMTPDNIGMSAKAFYIAGGEYLLYDATYYGDYPIIAITGSSRRLFAFGRNADTVVSGVCITSYIWDYRSAAMAIVRDVASGKKQNRGLIVFGLESGALGNTGYAEYRRYSAVDETYVAEVENCKQQIVSGEIKLDRPARRKAKAEVLQ